MPKRTISLSIEKEVYAKYLNYCKEKGLIISKQIENFMKETLRG